jgi:hypothetical protein
VLCYGFDAGDEAEVEMLHLDLRFTSTTPWRHGPWCTDPTHAGEREVVVGGYAVSGSATSWRTVGEPAARRKVWPCGCASGAQSLRQK